ncbi:hypothetical protein [Desulfolucanica intricata]|uniref:hypothetical protein n=1 Tax=Desulfolucanica intricata TaxID=1285191 RepID=UPI00082C09CE|nr:hypothetical protein [Desulfolucanica intricata]
MLSSVILLLILAIILLFSLRERVRLRHMREKNWEKIGESKTSVMSQAIIGLIGTAGGIYLSMVILFDFLEVDMPNRISMAGLNFEPIAAISFALAIIQPFILRFVHLSRHRY